VAITSFGLGGGSILSVAPDGSINVGPESAGASPGPACFALGGDQLTPTDVWLLLGYLEPGEFLGGRRRLDPAAAGAAAARLAQALGCAVPEALLRGRAAIHAQLAAQLNSWAARHPQLRDGMPDDRWLFSYGGGGGLLCTAAAESLGIRRVVVFPHSSVFSAFGAALLPLAHSYETVVPAEAAPAAVAAALARLGDNARRDFRTEGVTDLERVQASVGIDEREVRQTNLAALLRDPAGAADAGADGTARRCRLRVSAAHNPSVAMLTGGDSRSPLPEREVTTDSGKVTLGTVSGLGVPDSAPAVGPVFLQAPDTTIFVPGGWSVTFSRQGYGILLKKG
jgi:N-methylhydantoinase A